VRATLYTDQERQLIDRANYWVLKKQAALSPEDASLLTKTKDAINAEQMGPRTTFHKTAGVVDLLKEYGHSSESVAKMTGEQAREALSIGQSKTTSRLADAVRERIRKGEELLGRMEQRVEGYVRPQGVITKGEERIKVLQEELRQAEARQKALQEELAGVQSRIQSKAEGPKADWQARRIQATEDIKAAREALKQATEEEAVLLRERLKAASDAYRKVDVERTKGVVPGQLDEALAGLKAEEAKLSEALGSIKTEGLKTEAAEELQRVEAAKVRMGRLDKPLTTSERILGKAEEDLRVAKGTAERLSREIRNNKAALAEAGEWHELQGIPMFRDYLEEAIKNHGTSSTGWEVPEATGPWTDIFNKSKKAFIKDTIEALKKGAGLTEEAAEAEAKQAALFFSQDMTHAFAGKLKRFYNDVNQHMVERQIVSQTKAIPKKAWDDALKATQKQGATWEPIVQAFKTETGLDLGEFLPKGWEKLKPNGVMGPAPRGYSPTMQGGRFDTFRIFDGYIPTDWMTEYSRWRIGGTQSMLSTAIQAMGPLLAVTKLWKRMALAFPDYHTRNAATDFIRMAQEGLVSGYTASDLTTLYKHVFPEITRNGWGDFSKFAGVRVPGMEKTLDVLLKEASESGVLFTGPMWRVVFDASEDVANQLGQGKVKGMFLRGGAKEIVRDLKAGSIPNRLMTFGVNPRAIASREEFFRLSAFFEAQRQGMSVGRAGSAAQKALFDYSNLSPLGDFARRTGLAPFISFSLKNIAAQTRLLVEQPWQFAAMLHIQKAINEGNAPPPGALSRWARDKFNIHLRMGKDEHGRPQYEYVTLSGVIPQADLMDISQNWLQYGAGQLGPLFQTAYEVMKDQELPEEQQEGLARIAGERWGGKPARFVQQVVLGMPAYAEEEYLRKHGQEKQRGRLEKLKDYSYPWQTRNTDAIDSLNKAEGRIEIRMAQAKSKLKKQIQIYNSMETAGLPMNPAEADLKAARAKWNDTHAALLKEMLEIRRQKRRAMQNAAAP
jgi:hypothetical protein